MILLGGADADAYVTESASTTDLLESLLFSLLETAVFARIFLKELLADRNVILAENIVSKLCYIVDIALAIYQITNHQVPPFGDLA